VGRTSVEELLSLAEKENIKKCYLFHRHYTAAGLHLVCLQLSRPNTFHFSNIKIKLILPLSLNKRPYRQKLRFALQPYRKESPAADAQEAVCKI